MVETVRRLTRRRQGGKVSVHIVAEANDPIAWERLLRHAPCVVVLEAGDPAQRIHYGFQKPETVVPKCVRASLGPIALRGTLHPSTRAVAETHRIQASQLRLHRATQGVNHCGALSSRWGGVRKCSHASAEDAGVGPAIYREGVGLIDQAEHVYWT